MTQTVDAVGTEVRRFLLAGQPLTSDETLSVKFPFDGSEAARVALAGDDAVERALASAAAAEREIAELPPYRRAEILIAAAEIVRSRESELARQMTLETGNAVWETRFEAQRTAEILQIAGEEARRSASTGELVPIDAVPRGEGRIGLTRRFPVGTVLAITPFNAPLLLVAHKLGPALAAGCPCIVRPASKTPLSALSMGEILVEAGAPPRAVTVIPCRTELAERMVRDERVKIVSFTGSAEVGWRLQKVASTARVTLELGGNGAVIVEPDANLDYVAERCAFGGFLRAGQACISVQRLYAHTSIADALQGKLLAKIGELRTGNPLDESTVVGGLIDEAAAEKAEALVAEAVKAGGRVLCGGTREGTVLAPTLLVDVPETLRVCAEEAFAPIVVLSTYEDVDEVIERANDTPYGLQAGLFSNDIRVINRVFERLEVGALIVNDVNTFRVDQMPYGGAKRSGHGREGMRWAIREMTEERLLVIDPR
jgi:acyl-CoA reductase-like NAD-dependent aldehyde dehydrogenase